MPRFTAGERPNCHASAWLRRFGLLLLLTFALTGCFQQPLPDLTDLPDAPAGFPETKYQRLITEGWTSYTIDPAATLVQVRVYKEGRLARLGHNHVVSTRQLQGRIASNGDQIAADLFIRLDQLDVDRPELRAAAGEGFQSMPHADDIAGTRANMLSDKVLSATGWPFVQLRLDGLTATATGQQLSAQLTLHGVTQPLSIPITTQRSGGSVQVSGQIKGLVLSEFGVPRFSVLGGAIGVADAVDIEFQLSAVANVP